MGIIVDAHSDMLNDIHPRRMAGETGVLENCWVPRMRKGKLDLRLAGIWSDSEYLPEMALRRALDLIATLYEEIDESPSSILCTNYEDIIRAKEEGKIGFMFHMEGAEPLGCDIQLLRIFYALGVKVLSFTHALRTYLADGALFTQNPAGQLGGLTGFGVSVLEQAQDMGIIIDVSHLNDPGFWDIVKYSKSPLIATHSNCRALVDHPRNLTDDQIVAIANTGGVIGVNACRLFVGNGGLERFVDHIDHLVKVGGIDHVGLGPDFADYLVQYLGPANRAKFSKEDILPVDGFAGEEDYPRLAGTLESRGYFAKDIDRIMGENFVSLFKELLK